MRTLLRRAQVGWIIESSEDGNKITLIENKNKMASFPFKGVVLSILAVDIHNAS